MANNERPNASSQTYAETDTIPCGHCGQRVAYFALPGLCPSCGTHIRRPDHLSLNPMASSYVVKYAYHATVIEWDTGWGGVDKWSCTHEHDEVDEAVECGRAWIASLSTPKPAVSAGGRMTDAVNDRAQGKELAPKSIERRTGRRVSVPAVPAERE